MVTFLKKIQIKGNLYPIYCSICLFLSFDSINIFAEFKCERHRILNRFLFVVVSCPVKQLFSPFLTSYLFTRELLRKNLIDGYSGVNSGKIISISSKKYFV